MVAQEKLKGNVGIIFDEALTNSCQYYSVDEFINPKSGITDYKGYCRREKFSTYNEAVNYINSSKCRNGIIYGIWTSLWVKKNNELSELTNAHTLVNVFYKNLEY